MGQREKRLDELLAVKDERIEKLHEELGRLQSK